MSLLSRALRSQSSSLTNLQNLSTSGHSLSELASEATQLDDSVHSISFDINDREEQPHHSHSNEEEDELLFNVEEAGQEMPVRTALCGASLTQRRPPQELHFAAKPPLPDGSGGVAIPRQHSLQSSNPFSGSNFHLARSCPKPIVMKAKSRQPSFQQEDDLDLFIPPHELAASSLMDPANVAESLSRKGSAALRLRTGVLRRTGFYDGHTETLRTQPGSSFKA